MKTYLKDFMEKFSYPEEAKDALFQAFDRIDADASCREAFQGLLQSYEADISLKMRPLLNQMTEIAARAGVQEYTGHLLLCLCMSRHLLACYRKAGIDEQIWFTSMSDLKWKLMECRLVRGIWGTFVGEWFEGFFQMDRFGFLKLQFEPRVLDFRYEKDGLVLEPGTPMAIVHIPRTGGKLDKESMERSFDLAADFFIERYRFDPMVFVCSSWLLYPDNLEVLSPESNLYAFITTFDLVKSWESEDYYDAWRLFDKEYTGDVDQLPQDTSMRRAYADWIRKGKKFGGATGVYIYHKR